MRAHFNKKGEPTGYSEKVPKYLQPGFIGIFGFVLGMFIWSFIFIPATIYLWNKGDRKAKEWMIASDLSVIILWVYVILLELWG